MGFRNLQEKLEKYDSSFRLSGKVDRAGFSQEITVKFKDDKEDTIGKVSVTEKGLFSIYLPAAEVKISCNCNLMAIQPNNLTIFFFFFSFEVHRVG